MTLDNSTTPESAGTTGADAVPAKKPARRRVTRQAAAPQPLVGGDGTAEQAAPPAQAAAQPAPSLDVLAEFATPAAEPAPAAAPKRRRATASGRAPARSEAPESAPPAASAADTADEAPAAPARRSRSRAKAAVASPPAPTTASHEDEVATLDVVASIEALSAASDVPSDEAPAWTARGRRTRSAGRASGAPVDSAPQQAAEQSPQRTEQPPRQTELAPTLEALADAADAADLLNAPKRAPRTRGSRRATSAPQSTAPDAVTPDATSETRSGETVPVAEPDATEDAAPARTSRRTRATRPARGAGAPPSDAPVASTTTSDAPSRDEAPPEDVPAAEVTAPFRASTALLFQAPDASAVRTGRRRAQSPAGPPKPVTATTGPIDDEPAEDSVDELESDEGVESPEVDDTSAGSSDILENDDDEGDDDAASEANDAPRRRRRRGGRGRRNRGGSDNQPLDDEDGPDDEQGSSEDEGSTDDTHASDGEQQPSGRSRRRSRAGGAVSTSVVDDDEDASEDEDSDADESDESGSSRRRRRRRRGSRASEAEAPAAAAPRSPARGRTASDEVTALKGSTRLEAKRQRRREGRDAGRRRSVITEAEFLARRESVDRSMIVRERNGRTQIAVLEDGVLVEHYVSQQSQASMAGNVYLGRVQNVLPSMEAAFVDVGKGRNAVLYAGEVNWDAAGLEGAPRRIEQALKSGDPVLVQVTKDPIGHKGARLTSQITLAGRYLVYVPGGGMTGISRKLPDTERARLKKILREVVPETAGVIVRTAAEGASEDELRADIARLQLQWEAIQKKSKSASAPALLQGEPDLAIRVVRDIFNDDFRSLTISGASAWSEISEYVNELAPDLADRVTRWTSEKDVFGEARIDEQLAKGMDRKVWLPSGGSLVIDRTEAMTVVDVNTGKFTGSGGTLEETVTRNNLEAAEEIVRQLRLRDIGGIIVIDFIDMVLESNRDLVLRRLVECLGRDRTKHQVAEVTSLGLVQMTRKRVGQGLVEAFSETCEHCNGRGFIVQDEPIEKYSQAGTPGADLAPEHAHDGGEAKRSRRKRPAGKDGAGDASSVPVLPEAREAVKATLATIAAAAAHAHDHDHAHELLTHDEAGDSPAVSGDLDAGAEVEQAEEPERVAPLFDVLAELGGARPGAETDAASAPVESESTDATFPGADEPSTDEAPEPAADGADEAPREVPPHD
ncbi:Rne/Rng family ribonuclease [Sanguibacter sp. 25GB23B1]|uniref:Rne/Rng family ribonuclease n=1 Tax=unclassified Sanguibacter TaxID=2645534 RepID=UPI0032AF64DB